MSSGQTRSSGVLAWSVTPPRLADNVPDKPKKAK